MLRQFIRTNHRATEIESAALTVSLIGIDEHTVTGAAALLRAGFAVVCADADPSKVDALVDTIAAGGAGPVLQHALLAEQTLRLTDDPFVAVVNSSMTLICQGASDSLAGTADTYVLSVMGRMIGNALAHKDEYHVVVQQASVEPGTTRDVLVAAIEAASGLQAGEGFGACHLSNRLGDATSDDTAPFYAGVTDLVTASLIEDFVRRSDKRVVTTLIEISEMKSWVERKGIRASHSLPTPARATNAGRPRKSSHMLAPLKDAVSLRA